ncbi:recombination protein O N-terminal domain-containing protein [Streptomyces naganishii]|nr:recombination protein O N-terminal domain-containing protein [Streptomyces naganishii]
MSLFRDDGIVLRTREPGEAERIVPCSSRGRALGLRPGGRRGAR